MMESQFVQSVLSSPDKQRLGRGTYRVRSQGSTVILKQQPPSTTAISRLSRRLFRGSLPFRNELRIAAHFMAHPPTRLAVAKPLASDGRTFVLFEDLPGHRPKTGDAGLARQMVPGLVEFALAPLPGLPTMAQRAAFWVLQAPTARVLQRSLSARVRAAIGLRGAVRCLLVLAATTAATRRQRRAINIHNDLAPHNILVLAGRPFVLDFEDTVQDSRWLLTDVVDAAWDRSTLELDLDAVRELAAVQAGNGFHFALRRQLRFAMLRRSLMWIANGEVPDSMRPRLVALLRKTLLSRRGFASWCGERRIPND